MTDHDGTLAPAEIGGYRIVRTLGTGSRSTVLLGVRDARQVAVKVFGPGTSPVDVAREAETLARVEADHVVRLLDLCADAEGGRALVLECLAPRSLGDVLAIRSDLRAGEAVTALVPIVRAVGAAHARGITHGGIDARAILFDPSGAPVLSSWGSAGRIACAGVAPNRAELEMSDARAHDLRTLRELVVGVLGVCDTTRARECGESLANRADEAIDAARLEAMLFEVAVPMPISFAPTPESRVPAPHDEIRRAAMRPVPPHIAARRSDHRPSRVELMRRRLVDQRVRVGAATPIAAVRAAMSGVRRPLWVALGAAVVLPVMAFALLPSATDVTPSGAGAPTGASHSRTAPEPSTNPPESPDAGFDPLDDRVLAAEDPVAAARILLERRAECLAAAEATCLLAADQEDSAALDADLELLRSDRIGWEWNAASVTFVQELGGSALLSVEGRAPASDLGSMPGESSVGPAQIATQAPGQTATASLLVVRSEAGWRIRDLFGP